MPTILSTVCGGLIFAILTCICVPCVSSFPLLQAAGQAFLWSLATRENFVIGPEVNVVFKTLLILVCNSIKVKPIEEVTFGILEEQEREGKASEMEIVCESWSILRRRKASDGLV